MDGEVVKTKEGRQVCIWAWQSGDGKRRESPRASGELVENGDERAVGTRKVAGVEGHTDNLTVHPSQC